MISSEDLCFTFLSLDCKLYSQSRSRSLINNNNNLHSFSGPYVYNFRKLYTCKYSLSLLWKYVLSVIKFPVCEVSGLSTESRSYLLDWVLVSVPEFPVAVSEFPVAVPVSQSESQSQFPVSLPVLSTFQSHQSQALTTYLIYIVSPGPICTISGNCTLPIMNSLSPKVSKSWMWLGIKTEKRQRLDIICDVQSWGGLVELPPTGHLRLQ